MLESWGAATAGARVLCTAAEGQPLPAATREKPAERRGAGTAENNPQSKTRKGAKRHDAGGEKSSSSSISSEALHSSPVILKLQGACFIVIT